MKKTKKLLAVLAAIAATVFSVAALAACGEPDVNGTYKLELSKEDCAGNLYLAGFMDSAGATQTNTLVLTDGNYKLTKHIVSTNEEQGPLGVDVTITFTGSYTATKAEITLSKATDAEYEADYGVFYTLGTGLLNDSGKASDGDKVECFGTHSYDPLVFFGGEFYNPTVNEEVKITVDKTNKTYSYVKVASSDDD